jgi:hypothetical protein
LVAGCYLAKAGRRVLVLEAGDKLGGGSRTDETIPGYHFNTHSAAHNIINMTSIPAELDLARAGLEYIPMEPFATGFFREGRIVRFHRDIEQTVASIAEHDKADAEAYRAFMHKAVPLVKTAVTGSRAARVTAGPGGTDCCRYTWAAAPYESSVTSPDAPEGDELMVTGKPYGERRCSVRSPIVLRHSRPKGRQGAATPHGRPVQPAGGGRHGSVSGKSPGLAGACGLPRPQPLRYFRFKATLEP